MGGQLDEPNRLLARDGREALKEVVERIAGFEMIDEGAHRNAGPLEDRSAADHVRVDGYDFPEFGRDTHFRPIVRAAEPRDLHTSGSRRK